MYSYPYFICKETEILTGDHQGNMASLLQKNLIEPRSPDTSS